MALAGNAASTAQKRLLLALNSQESAFFLPMLKGVELNGVDCQFVDTSDCSADEWNACLCDWDPHVLVSCWSTPSLPLSFVGDSRRALQYICHLTGSVRHVAPRRFLELGGIVSNWGDLACAQVAEHALLLALAALRGLYNWRSFIQAGDGSIRYQAVELSTETLFGRQVGLHGFGRIARALVKLLEPFQVKICAYSDGVPSEFIEAHGVRACESIRDLFRSSDVLFECETLTEKSERSVTGDLIALLADDSVFVNVGRGAVVDEAALIAEAGRLRIALDVVTTEPISAADPFFDAPHTILSPHIAGPTFDQYLKCGELAVSNLIAFFEGRAVSDRLSLSDFDRAT